MTVRARSQRNRLAAAIVSTTKVMRTASCAIWKGASVCVGASAWSGAIFF